jgi:hypothetical protein
VGEVISSSVSTQAITTATTTNVTSISLTAGDWDVYGSVRTHPAASTTQDLVLGAISTTSATLPNIYASIPNYPAGFGGGCAAPTIRLSLASTTTVYLIGYVSYAVSTLTISGNIYARRAR